MGSDFESLASELDDAFAVHGRKPCIVVQGGQIVTFASFFNVVLSLSERLRLLGVQPGGLVAVTVPQYELSLALRLAVLRLGATIFSMREIDRTESSGVEIDKIISLRERPTFHPREVFFSSEWVAPPLGFVFPASGGGFVHATSGSSGVPKLRHDTDQVFRARIASNQSLRGNLSGAVLNAQNIATLIGQKIAICALLEGQLQLGLQGSMEETLAALRQYEVAEAFIPPSHLRQACQIALQEHHHFPYLKRIHVGGGAISLGFAHTCEHVFSAELYSDYGSTETDTVASGRVVEGKQDRTIYRSYYPGVEIRLDKTENGLVRVWVPESRRTNAFFEDEELFDRDGWITLDDIGVLNPDGSLEILGRNSDIINVGGNKFAPHVLEALADGFPGISEIAAFKMPSVSHIDGIGFAVVFSEEEEKESLAKYLSQRIAVFHELEVFPVSSIPRTQGEKVDRNELSRAFSRRDEAD